MSLRTICDPCLAHLRKDSGLLKPIAAPLDRRGKVKRFVAPTGRSMGNSDLRRIETLLSPLSICG